MKRFLSVLIVLMACLPVGVSLVGCGTNVSNFCDATETTRTNQVTEVLLQPETGNVSLAYTQTQLLGTPQARNCLGGSVGVPKYSWASTNPALLDISATGNMCAGSWNRNSGGGIADYTICSAPTKATVQQLLDSGGGTYDNFYVHITASADGVSSNPVTVYSHPQVSAAFGYTVPGTAGAVPQCITPSPINCNGVANQTLPAQQCYSQVSTTPVAYCAVVCAEATGPDGTTGLVDVTGAAGSIKFAPANSNVVSIDPEGIAQPIFPGATLVTASVSGVTAAAGIYSTCAPASMTLRSSVGSSDPVLPLNVNISQDLVLDAVDSTGAAISLNGLIYTATTPRTLGVTSGGVVTPVFGGNGDVYAACLPPSCNPSPISDIGLFATTSSGSNYYGSGGSGVSLTSNPINVVTQGTQSNYAYLANFDVVDYPNANYFVLYNSVGNIATSYQTIYRPNSMLLSNDSTRLYLGSQEGLMIYAASGAIGLQSASGPGGRVVAVSPDDTTLIISGTTSNLNGGTGQPVIIVYSVANGSILSTQPGVAYSAQFSADNNTVYIAAGNLEYVYSKITGWSQYATVNGETNVYDVVSLLPAVGAFFGGSNVAARTYCPDTTVSPAIYNPQTTVTSQSAERLGISADGVHMFGATTGTAANFNDFCIGIPTNLGNRNQGSTTSQPNCGLDAVAPIAACSPNNSFAVSATSTTVSAPVPAGNYVTGLPVASTVPCTNQGQSSPCTSASSTVPTSIYTALVTYSNCTNTETETESCSSPATGTGTLPYYLVATGQPGTTGSVQLSNPSSAIAPIAPTSAAISADNTTAYVTTSGDNALHVLSLNNMTGVPTENLSTNPPVPIHLPADYTNPGSGIFISADKVLVRPYQAN